MRKQNNYRVTSIILIINMLMFLQTKAQDKAVIDLTLINAEELVLQQRLFFAEQPNYILDPLKGISPQRLMHSHELKNYKLLNISNGHYKLEYSLKSPKLIYLNYKPLFIKPGDSLKLTYNVLEHTFDTMRDTLIAVGKNGQNYEHSTFVKWKASDKSLDDDLVKNTADVNESYRQIKAYYTKLKNYQDSILKQKNCDETLRGFVKRTMERTELFTLLFFENRLYSSSDKKAVVFSKIIDVDMNARKYEPGDTAYNFGMENLIKAGFKRTIKVKFNNLDSKDDYLAMVNYISNISDPFIRDYYVYFLVMNFRSLDLKYPSDILQKCKNNLTNNQIKTVLDKQSYL